MEDDTRHAQSQEKRGLFDALFPREHDFEGMLSEQAGRTTAGVQAFVDWLQTPPLSRPAELERIEDEVDAMRHELETKLINSFSTPFDRQDIYSISRTMDYILNFSKETAREMVAFQVGPDPHILAMAGYLLSGTSCIGKGIRAIGSDKARVEEEIRHGRDAYNTLDDVYIVAMAELLATSDPMNAIRMREIYHHLRDAGRAMRDTLDILHNAVIDLA